MLRTRSGLRIRSWWEDDEVGLVWDNGKQCFSALPFSNLYHSLLALWLASVADLISSTPTHPPTRLATSAASLRVGVIVWCFSGSTDDVHCVGSSRDGMLTHLARCRTHVAHAPGFLTRVSNLRFRSMLAQHHRHTTHTDCWNELGAQCTTRSCL